VGGWGALLRYNGHTRELCGGERLTTNNRMELLAVIRALEALTKPCEIRLHTDSTYVQKGISEWIHSWKKRDWRTADKKPVKNDDLWKELDRLTQRHKIEWLWVRGHSGHDGNEQADRLANQGVQSVLDAAAGRIPDMGGIGWGEFDDKDDAKDEGEGRLKKDNG
jgi:ribonuclease HI